MTQADIGLFEAMGTECAIRSSRTDAVPREIVTAPIEAVTKALSSGNSQPWVSVAVGDPGVRGRLAADAHLGFAHMYEQALRRTQPAPPRSPVSGR